MNYLISALALVFAVLFFIKSVLPRTLPPMTMEEELNPRALDFKLTVLSLNSVKYKPRGGGLNVRALLRCVRKTLQSCRKKSSAGEELQEFERQIFLHGYQIEAAMRNAEKASLSFFSLPHCGKFPRLYDFCAMLVKYNGGYVSGKMLERGVQLFNEHSPLIFSEISLLPDMLSYCLLEQIAVLCGKSLLMDKIAARAKRDANKEKIDLTYLKYNTYIYAYMAQSEGGNARKFAAVCLENDEGVRAKTDEFAVKCARYNALCKGVTDCLFSVVPSLSEDSLLALYGNYEQFMNAPDLGFSLLDTGRKVAYLQAFSDKCRREKKSETQESSRIVAEGETLQEAFLPRVPDSFFLRFLIFSVFASGVLASTLIAVFAFPAGLFAALVLLPVFICFFCGCARLGIKGVFKSLYLPSQGSKRLSAKNLPLETSRDYAIHMSEQIGTARKEHDEKTSARKQSVCFDETVRFPSLSERLNAFDFFLFRTEKLLSHIVSLAALIAVFLAPFVSAWLIVAAFLLQEADFFAALRAGAKAGHGILQGIRRPVADALFLPSFALGSVLRVYRTTPPKWAIWTVQAGAGAALFCMTLFLGANPVFYVVSALWTAACALLPLMRAGGKWLSAKNKGEFSPPDTVAQECVYEDSGLYPRVRFLTGGEYTCVADERGGGFDCYGGERFLENMRIFVECGGKKERLRYVLPFVTQGCRIIYNAVGAGRTFSVEIVAMGDGGKTVCVKAHGGGCFTYWCVHDLAGDVRETALKEPFGTAYDTFCAVQSVPRAQLLFAVSTWKAANGSVVFNRARFFYDADDGKSNLFAVKAASDDGAASFVFTADFSETALRQKTACAFKDGFLLRSRAKAEAFLQYRRLTPALYETASHILYGHCCYEERDLARYLDLRYFTLLVYLKSVKGMERLYTRLKGLSELKRLGLCFNVVVLAFENASYFAGVEGKVNAMFDELCLGHNGKATCVNCENNANLYGQMKRSGVFAENIRFVPYVQNPSVKSYVRKSAALSEIAAVPSAGAMSADACGKGVYRPVGRGALAENVVSCVNGMGFVARCDGTGCTYASTSPAERLTADTQDAHAFPSEFVFFSETNRCWSATALPLGEREEIRCIHGKGYTAYDCGTNGILITQTVFLAEEKRSKLYRIELKNTLKQYRSVSVLLCVRPSLGVDENVTAHMLKFERLERGVAAHNVILKKSLYCTVNVSDFSSSFHMQSVTDEKGNLVKPTVLRDEGVDRALILCAEVKLPPSGIKTVCFALGETPSYDFDAVTTDFEKSVLSHAPHCRFQTRDERDGLFIDALNYQARVSLCPPPASQMRQGEHFAVALLKSAALTQDCPARSKAVLLEACAKRFVNGDILLYKSGERGERACRHSASLFLPMAAADYVDCTDDRDVLFERVAYLESGGTAGGKVCRPSYKKASVLEHCLQSLRDCMETQCCDCFGIDHRLLLLRALQTFMPLVTDGETRLLFADRKAELARDLKALNVDEVTAVNLAWLVINGVVTGKTAARLLREKAQGAEEAPLTERLWRIAALLVCGETESANALFDSLNPLKKGEGYAMLGENGLPRPRMDETAAIAYRIAAEGIFGCSRKGDCLVLSPRLPSSVRWAKIELDTAKANVGIDVDNTGEGPWRVQVNNIRYNVNSLVLSEKLNGKQICLTKM